MRIKSARLANQARNWAPHIWISALAGLIASIPMALVMQALHRLLPRREQYLLPPEQITVSVADRTHTEQYLEGKERRKAATWLAHLGYGAASASLYPLVTNQMHWPPVLRGMLFAMGVWTASYMGWLPAAGILPAAVDMPARRNALMIVSHLVWGTLIGLMVDRMEKRKI